MPNVRAKLPAEARSVSLVRDDASRAADQAYAACRASPRVNPRLVRFQRLDVRFPIRTAGDSMSMDRLLTVPARSEASSGSRTRLPLHPTGMLAGRFAPCLACNCSCSWPVGPQLAGLGIGSLLRRAVELEPSVTSHRLRALPDGADKHCGGFGLRCAADARPCASC